MPKVVAFDCFGTVFDMSSIPKSDIAAYVAHVKREDFSPFQFPESWFKLKAHPDSAEGIYKLQQKGFVCVTLSNGSQDLLKTISDLNGIDWNTIIDLMKYRAYKPHNLDAYRAVEKETGWEPAECLMVTANPTFGDLESCAKIGMPTQVIRHGYPHTIVELAHELGC